MPPSRTTHIKHQYVDVMPSEIAEGVLYISKRFNTAIHKCCCGCGLEVVTPLNAAKWSLKDHGSTVSLTPSIGNWSFPCHAHYWIQQNQVHWAKPMSEGAIRNVKVRDRKDVALLAHAHGRKQGWWSRLTQWLRGSDS